MAEARSEQLWDHTSAIAATVMNTVRGKGAPVYAEQLHPHRKRRRVAATAESSKQGFAMLRKLTVGEIEVYDDGRLDVKHG